MPASARSVESAFRESARVVRAPSPNRAGDARDRHRADKISGSERAGLGRFQSDRGERTLLYQKDPENDQETAGAKVEHKHRREPIEAHRLKVRVVEAEISEQKRHA